MVMDNIAIKTDMDYIKAWEQTVEKYRKQNTEYETNDYEDMFKLNGESMFSVGEYWKFAFGNIESYFDILAEFLVAKSLGIEKAENVKSWTAYDMSYRNKRIEVKSTAYVHPWNELKGISKVRTFSIAPSSNEYWEEDNIAPREILNPEGKRKSRQSEVYVFCINEQTNPQNRNFMELDDWTFYVVPTYVINEYAEKNNNPEQKTISLGVLHNGINSKRCKYDALKSCIDEAIDKSDDYYREKYL